MARRIDVELLFRLWADSTLNRTQIASLLGVGQTALRGAEARYGLPKRSWPAGDCTKRIVDPTPEEIRDRKREMRRKHFAMRRAETDECTRIKVWRTA